MGVFHVKQGLLLMVLRSKLNPLPDEPHSGVSEIARELRADQIMNRDAMHLLTMVDSDIRCLPDTVSRETPP
ncbi:MAG: hypothetical protein NT113_03930 [Hyphomicrobiales bacterium]|nr:hypothetical protein [Hyphomicrobiales bacterium]